MSTHMDLVILLSIHIFALDARVTLQIVLIFRQYMNLELDAIFVDSDRSGMNPGARLSYGVSLMLLVSCVAMFVNDINWVKWSDLGI